MNAAERPRLRRPRWRAVGPAVSLALLGVFVWALAPWLPLEARFGLPALFGWRGVLPPPDGVVVVAIDERAAATLGLPERPRQWPRRLHAELVRTLAAHGARFVAFDLTFDTPTPDDAAFAQAMREAGNVLLTSSLRRDGWREDTLQAVVEQVRPAVSPIGEAARAQAPFVLPKDARVDAYWTFRDRAAHVPSLPVLAFHLSVPQAVDALAAASCAVDPAGCAALPDAGFAASPSPVAVVQRLRERLWGDPAHAEAVERRLGPDAAPDLRTLLQLHRGDDSALVGFRGPARSVRTVSYADVASAAAADPSLFRDRVVFVGYSAASAGAQDRLRDDYRTVFADDTGVDVSGVEIAATAYADLREGSVPTAAPAAAALALVAGWGLLLGAVAVRLRPLGQAVLTVPLALALAWAVAQGFARHAQWWPLVVPLAVQWPAAVLLGLVVSHRRSRRERDRLHQAFSYFVPRTLVEQLGRAPGRVHGAHRITAGACLYSDAASYTTLAERLDPGALGETINRYLALLFAPVERNGGWVADVVGDAMVAVWEMPGDDADARARRGACVAALEMSASLQSPAADDDAPARLPTRIGLACGPLRIGTVGAGQRYEFRAVGDAVNTASRLEGLNKRLGTRVLASAAMVAGLDGLVLRPLGAFRLAGKREAVDVVELMAADAPAAARRCALFADAFAHWQAGDPAAALDGWERLLAEVPDDGPARFYADRARALCAGEPLSAPDEPIVIETK